MYIITLCAINHIVIASIHITHGVSRAHAAMPTLTTRQSNNANPVYQVLQFQFYTITRKTTNWPVPAALHIWVDFFYILFIFARSHLIESKMESPMVIWKEIWVVNDIPSSLPCIDRGKWWQKEKKNTNATHHPWDVAVYSPIER